MLSSRGWIGWNGYFTLQVLASLSEERFPGRSWHCKFFLYSVIIILQNLHHLDWTWTRYVVLTVLKISLPVSYSLALILQFASACRLPHPLRRSSVSSLLPALQGRGIFPAVPARPIPLSMQSSRKTGRLRASQPLWESRGRISGQTASSLWSVLYVGKLPFPSENSPQLHSGEHPAPCSPARGGEFLLGSSLLPFSCSVDPATPLFPLSWCKFCCVMLFQGVHR